jgi:hypothetical protein
MRTRDNRLSTFGSSCSSLCFGFRPLRGSFAAASATNVVHSSVPSGGACSGKALRNASFSASVRLAGSFVAALTMKVFHALLFAGGVTGFFDKRDSA